MSILTPTWLKYKGYIHVTPQIDIVGREKELVSKITNPEFVKSYAFFPLIHSSIKERKYKKISPGKRAHSYKKEDQVISTAKQRPLHYSCHMDALVFGYYAEMLQKKYEEQLLSDEALNSSVIAYRRIPIAGSDKNKSTIHFAKEVFDEIRKRGVNECSVLMFDIKSFFSTIDHDILRRAWAKLLNVDILPKDHLNVFNAATRFSYILYDDLRTGKVRKGRKKGLDEKRLHEIRKLGKSSFFESAKEFRDKLKSKELRLYRFPFRNSDKKPIGIPQGLAISAVLANLYLLDFDREMVSTIIYKYGGFYRRYSDDILIICDPSDAAAIKDKVISMIKESKVVISEDKTEQYIFRKTKIGKKGIRLSAFKKDGDKWKIGVPLTYLGFEFYGEKILIKSANLSKFYRRMIYAVKSKAKRARVRVEGSPVNKYAIFRRQLYKLYTIQDLNKTKIRTSFNRLEKTELGYYKLKVIKIDKPLKSNYLSYVKRASMIMEDESISNQIRNHKRIFNEAIAKHLRKHKV
jgi:hypothetical protein